MPGQLWLQFEAQQLSDGRTQLVETIFVDARGLLGLLYWYLTYPVHTRLFGGLSRKVARLAEASSSSDDLSASVPAMASD